MKKEINVCGGSGSQNLQGFRPLPCVLCCLSDLENPGKKERKLNFSHLPSIQTCKTIGQDEATPFTWEVVLAGVAVGLGRASQPRELPYDPALTSEALQKAALLMPTRRLTFGTCPVAQGGRASAVPGAFAPRTAVATTTLSAGKFNNISKHPFISFHFFESSMNKDFSQ